MEEERRRREEDVERERSGRLEAEDRAGRLAQEHARLEEEHARVREEIRELREALEAERSKGFWRRLSGG